MLHGISYQELQKEKKKKEEEAQLKLSFCRKYFFQLLHAHVQYVCNETANYQIVSTNTL